jgi:hypothetical protein
MAIEYSEAQDPNLKTTEVMAPEMSEEILAADPMAQEPIIDEGVEVAGYRDKIANVIRKPIRKKGEDLTKPATNFQDDVDNPIVEITPTGPKIRRATTEEMSTVETWAINKDEGFDVIIPNMQAVGFVKKDGTIVETDEEAIAPLFEQIDNIFELYKDRIDSQGKKLIRKGQRGFAEILKDADAIGSVKILTELMKRNAGDRPFTDAEYAAAKRMQEAVRLNVQELLLNYKQTNSLMDLAKLAQGISMQGLVTVRIAGVEEDIGRTLVSMKLFASAPKAYKDAVRTMMDETETLQKLSGSPSGMITRENIGEFLEAYGGEEGMLTLIAMHQRLPNEDQAKFASRSIYRKGADMLIELYQSALLSNPLTHAYNTAGNLIMMETQMIERVLQGKPREGFAMLTAQAKYMPQAFRAMWYALKHEASLTDATTKLDSNMKAISRSALNLRNKKEGGGTIESTAALAFDAFGVMMRLGGYRPMIAMDEFSKALSRGMQIEALAVRAKSDAYRATINAGKSKLEATEASVDAYLKMLHSESAFDEGTEFAKMVTFQDELPGLLGDAMPLLSHPIMKIWLPFYKTPTQIVRRLGERSPFALAMPSVMRDKLIRGSAEDKKEAMARIAFGSSIAATTMYLGKGGVSDDFVMTGYGPSDKSRSRWLENHQPYSIGIRKEDGSFDWISYERYDPISGIIGMAMDGADVVEKAWDGGWDSFSVDTGLNLAFVIAKYPSKALPMIQFIGELTDMAGSPYMSAEDKFARLEGMFAKQVIKAGLIVKEQVQSGGLLGDSLQATFERFQDPLARSTIPEDQYNGNIVDAYYQALHEMRARTPGLSTTLPSRKNRWYEEVYQTGHTMEDGRARGNIWQTFLPYRVMNKPEKSLINQELEILNNGLSPLRRNMGESKLKLTGEQYDRYIELYNFPWRVKDPNNKINIEERISAKDAIEEIFKDTDYYKASFGDRLRLIKNVDAEYKDKAKRLMLYEYPELGALIAQRDAYENTTGKLPKKLDNLTETDLLNFLESRK